MKSRIASVNISFLIPFLWIAILCAAENSSRPNAAELKILDAQVLKNGASSELELVLHNSGAKFLEPQLWAELYDQLDRHIGRVNGETFAISPGQSVKTRINLSNLGLGKYKVIVAGKFTKKEIVADLKSSAIFVEHLPVFTVAVNRNKELAIIPAQTPLGFTPQQQPRASETGAPRSAAVAQSPEPADGMKKQESSVAGNITTTAPALADDSDADEVASAVVERHRIAKSEDEPRRAKRVSRTYTVKKGDWLSKISLKYYGDVMLYWAIFSANRSSISNPDLIYPGQTLQIPYKEDNPELFAQGEEKEPECSESMQKIATASLFTNRLSGEIYLGTGSDVSQNKALPKDMLENYGAPGFESLARAGCWQSAGDLVKNGVKPHFLSLLRMIEVPFLSNSNRTSSIKDVRIKMPRPLSLRRFSGASGSLT